jgi:NAD(P)-dependent dehydrogenase (short-subunit alcohol dehydrogenase family)
MFLTVKALVGQLREQPFGRVVNISSNTIGLVIGGFAHYMASKGAVIGLTRALATDLGADGISVNAVAPGLTRTTATEAQWAGTGFFAEMALQQALKRPGVPSDLAGVISFLASEDAGWITGQTIVVDGGLVRH